MKSNKRVKIGVIADDFTGASDSASFLSKSGAKTIMFTSVPEKLEDECDAVVLALKSRSVHPSKAIDQTREAVDFLKKIDCEKVYVKYCSTFDSTPKGNIGVVLDFLMEYLHQTFTILCPSLPINGRTVKDGNLYVNGILLNHSPMKDHPLNPMWDSYIPKLMEPQSKYPCFVVKKEELNQAILAEKVRQLSLKNKKFYLVPDYESDEDGKNIARQFKELPLVSGGSGLLEFILDERHETENQCQTRKPNQKSIILCGSCSQATKRQVEHYRTNGGLTYAIDSKRLLNHSLTAEEVFSYVLEQKETVLIYSDAIDANVNDLKKSDTFSIESKLVEDLMASLSVKAIANKFQRIVVAGGETSGAVTLSLGYDGFYIGESIDPGVPVLYPLKKETVSLVLKSGNFGCEAFFMKATKGE